MSSDPVGWLPDTLANPHWRPRHSLVYLSGPPGVGKSTLMRELTRHCTRELFTHPLAHDILTPPRRWSETGLEVPGAAELGRRRDTFSGTDALPMNAVVSAEEYMARPGRANGLILAEGDRLANRRFLTNCALYGWEVTLLHLDAPQELLDDRCAQRGSHQNDAWRRGRVTKARRLADLIDGEGVRVVHLDGRNTVDCLAASAVAAVPVLTALLPGTLEDGQQR